MNRHGDTTPALGCGCERCAELVQARREYVATGRPAPTGKHPGFTSAWVRGENHVERRTMDAGQFAHYRRSRAWALVREMVLERDGHRCRVCGSTDGLEVHHRTYARLGEELLGDLVALCDGCHAHFHFREFGEGRGRALSRREFARTVERMQRGPA